MARLPSNKQWLPGSSAQETGQDSMNAVWVMKSRLESRNAARGTAPHADSDYAAMMMRRRQQHIKQQTNLVVARRGGVVGLGLGRVGAVRAAHFRGRFAFGNARADGAGRCAAELHGPDAVLGVDAVVRLRDRGVHAAGQSGRRASASRVCA